MISITAENLSVLESHIKQYMSNYDSSHDWLHIQRVRKTARELALDESARRPVDVGLVDIAALLHDVGDVKYCKPGEDQRSVIANLLAPNGIDPETIDKVCVIVENVSFRKELENNEKGQNNIYAENAELACVQDADRLDAIGAIGMARCLAFSGARNRPIYNPDIQPLTKITSSQYNQQTVAMNGTALNHFLEKLVHLGGMMKTCLGRRLAAQRTAFMYDFINQIKEECDI